VALKCLLFLLSEDTYQRCHMASVYHAVTGEPL
jgi:hypothetical protein